MDDDCSHEIKRHLLQYLYFKLNLQEDSFIELFAMQHEDFTKEDLMELKAQRKDKERQEEEVTEESQCRKQESDFLYLRSTVSFESQDLNAVWYTKVEAAVQNTVQYYPVIYDKKNKATTKTSLDHFFQEGR